VSQADVLLSRAAQSLLSHAPDVVYRSLLAGRKLSWRRDLQTHVSNSHSSSTKLLEAHIRLRVGDRRMTGGATRRKPPGWMLYFLVAGIMLAFLRKEFERNAQVAAIAALLVAITSVWVISRAHPGRWISVGSSYAVLFSLFHMSQLFPLVSNSPVPPFVPNDRFWIQTPGFHSAVVLAAIAQAMFTLGYLVNARTTGRVRSPHAPIEVRIEEATILDGPGIVGVTMLVLGIVLWIYSVSSTGASFFGTSLLGFLALTQNTHIADSYLLISFGMAVVSSSRWVVLRHRALLFFGLWSIPAFVLGLRGEVIIPIAAYLIVAARRRPIALRPWVLAAAGIGALAAGSAVRVVRQYGAGARAFDVASFNPFAGLAEMGGSIQPLTIVVNYHQSGEPFIGVDTYLAPFRRLIVKRILGGDALPVKTDPAVFSSMIAQRVGQIGGSPAAEAYRSGGVFVMVILMLLIGVIVASLDSLPNTTLMDSLVGMLACVLLIWVRNDFTPVPAQAFEAFIVLVPIWLLEQWSKTRSKGLFRYSQTMVNRPGSRRSKSSWHL
jgi:hypothetical protein